jgi:HSP20 family protein
MLFTVSWPQTFMPADLGDLAEDVRRVFRELEHRPGGASVAGQCTPALDVFETDETVELLVDLPGTPIDAVRVLLKGSVVLIAGEKAPEREGARGAGDFHLVERAFGRFARGIRVAAAFDGSRARATLSGGELRVVLPKMHDRRGRAQMIPLTDGNASHS